MTDHYHTPSEEGAAQRDRDKAWYQSADAQPYLFVGAVLVYCLIGLVLWSVLDWYIDPQSSGQKKDLVQALGLIMAGLAGAGGIYFTWRNLSNARDQLDTTQESTHAQVELTRKGQITDRFTKAIDQLGATDDDGNKQLEIRLGGIYALEQIATDSVEHYGQIIEILTAYIRKNARWAPKELSLPPTAEDEEWAKWEMHARTPVLSNAPADIQAILDVLARRKEDRVPIHYRADLQLQGTDLRGAVLTGASLSEALFNEANLQDAYLLKAGLEHADFKKANLQRARLHGTRLTGADLTDARLEGAYLGGTFISDLSVREVRLLGLDETYVGRVFPLPAANLREVIGLDKKQLDLAIGSPEIELPQSIEQPAMWDKSEQEQREIIKERMKKPEILAQRQLNFVERFKQKITRKAYPPGPSS